MDTVCFTAHFKRRICQYNYPGFRSFAGLQQTKCLHLRAAAFPQAFPLCAKTKTISTLNRNAVAPFGSASGAAQPAASTPGASGCCTHPTHGENRHQRNQPQLEDCYRKAKLLSRSMKTWP